MKQRKSTSSSSSSSSGQESLLGAVGSRYLAVAAQQAAMDGVGVINAQGAQVHPPMRLDSELWSLIVRNVGERPSVMESMKEQEWGVLFWALGKCGFDYAAGVKGSGG